MADTTALNEAFARGDLAGAFQQATTILRSEPDNADALRIVGRIRMFQGLYPEARAIAERCVASTPDDPDAHLLMAQVQTASGDSDAALASCAKCLELAPERSDARIARARVLERRRDADAALTELDAVPESDRDDDWRYLYARSLLTAGRTDDAIAFMQDVDASMLKPRTQYRLGLLLAKALDRAGRYDDAMAAAIDARAVAMTPDHAKAAFVDQADAAIRATDRMKLRTAPRSAVARKAHIFIAGMPRSGTTLVEQILDAHPDATGVGEMKEIDVAARRLQQIVGAWAPYPDCLEFTQKPHLDQIVQAYERAISDAGFPETAAYVNKNLFNALHLGFIARLFPFAKVIVTRRDPRDIAVSCMMAPFRPEAMPHLADLDAIVASIAATDRLIEHWKTQTDLDIHEVDYEQLVREPESAIRAMLDFCELPWDDRCARFWESDRTVMTLAYDQVNRPMYDSSVGRWRNYERTIGPAFNV